MTAPPVRVKMPPMDTRFAGLALGSLAALVSTALGGCSLALDFDREYRVVESQYPAEYLPKDNGAPVADMPAACLDFCTTYTGCMARKCDTVDKLPDKPAADGASVADYIRNCASDCETVGTLTARQVSAIDDQKTCRDVAAAQSVSNQDYCNYYVDLCDAWCSPDASHAEGQDLTACYPIMFQGSPDRCHAACMDQTYDFFYCMSQQDQSVPICAKATACLIKPKAGLTHAATAP